MIDNGIPVDDILWTMYPDAEDGQWFVVGVDGDPSPGVAVENWDLALGPKPSEAEILANQDSAVMANNAEKAQVAQNYSIEEYTTNKNRVDMGLDPSLTPELEAEHTQYAEDRQPEIDNPSTDPTYKPPVPPGVNVPDTWSFRLTFTREPGWNNVLGWKAVMTDWVEGYFPANASISVYSAEQCTGYLYTPGAFVQEGDEWVINCPAGQEQGDVDYFFGVSYSGVSIECRTFMQGEQTMIWEVNDS